MAHVAPAWVRLPQGGSGYPRSRVSTCPSVWLELPLTESHAKGYPLQFVQWKSSIPHTQQPAQPRSKANPLISISSIFIKSWTKLLSGGVCVKYFVNNFQAVKTCIFGLEVYITFTCQIPIFLILILFPLALEWKIMKDYWPRNRFQGWPSIS